MQLQYNKKVLEHFRNPKNMGEIKKPDGEAVVGNPVCGDVMKMMIKVKSPRTRTSSVRGRRQSKVKSKKEYIKEIKFQTLGCGAAIATSSVLTEMAKGKSLEEALKIKNAEIARELGGLPEIKMHCSVLAAQALREAIEDYREKKGGKGDIRGRREKGVKREKGEN